MVEQRQSAMQRIQVGLIGLVVVLLFVSLANMVLDRVGGDPGLAAISGGAGAATDKDGVPDEPLAELGIAPVANGPETAKALAAPAQNIRQVPRQQ